MKRMLMCAGVLCLCCGIAPAQEVKELLQQMFGEIKQSVVQNQTQLRAYQWIETTELSLKGEVKSRSQQECRFGADGRLIKTPIGEPADTSGAARGIRGRIVEKKVDELQDYMDRFGSLVGRYVPPDPSRMQESFESGKTSFEMTAGGNIGAIVFKDYVKPGDKVTFTFDAAAKKLRNFKVSTYLDSPEDAVTVDARFTALDDGTNYVEDTVMTSRSKQLQIKITNFGHRKSGL